MSDDWKPMADAPQNATWVMVKMKDGTEHRAHWASDLSGEEQPPFEGWFIKKPGIIGFVEIGKPVAWKPEKKH